MSELLRHIIVRELTIKVFDDGRMTFEMDTTPVEPDPGSTAYTQVSRPVHPPTDESVDDEPRNPSAYDPAYLEKRIDTQARAIERLTERLERMAHVERILEGWSG